MSLWRVSSHDQEPEIALALWRVFQTDFGTRHFVGWRGDSGSGRVSTDIVEFDPGCGLGRTESGRTYRLVGPPAFSVDALATWRGWALVNGVSSTDDLSEEFYASMRHAGFDAYESVMLGIEPPEEPHFALTSLPDDFPTFTAPRRWGLGGQELLPESRPAQIYIANFCERQAQEVAEEFRDSGLKPTEKEAALSLVYGNWQSGLFINEAERVWVVKRTASLLGWDCPQLIFEIKSETLGKQ